MDEMRDKLTFGAILLVLLTLLCLTRARPMLLTGIAVAGVAGLALV